MANPTVTHHPGNVAADGPQTGVGSAIMSTLGGIGVVLLLPLAVIAIGLPIVLVVRGLVEVATWLAGLFGG